MDICKLLVQRFLLVLSLLVLLTFYANLSIASVYIHAMFLLSLLLVWLYIPNRHPEEIWKFVMRTIDRVCFTLVLHVISPGFVLFLLGYLVIIILTFIDTFETLEKQSQVQKLWEGIICLMKVMNAIDTKMGIIEEEKPEMANLEEVEDSEINKSTELGKNCLVSLLSSLELLRTEFQEYSQKLEQEMVKRYKKELMEEKKAWEEEREEYEDRLTQVFKIFVENNDNWKKQEKRIVETFESDRKYMEEKVNQLKEKCDNERIELVSQLLERANIFDDASENWKIEKEALVYKYETYKDKYELYAGLLGYQEEKNWYLEIEKNDLINQLSHANTQCELYKTFLNDNISSSSGSSFELPYDYSSESDISSKFSSEFCSKFSSEFSSDSSSDSSSDFSSEFSFELLENSV